MTRWIEAAPYDSPEDRRHREDGRPICRWCGWPVPKGRRTWCSQTCIDEYLVRKNPGDARNRVFRRDRGVCAVCGIDTESLDEALNHLWGRRRRHPYRHRVWEEPSGYEDRDLWPGPTEVFETLKRAMSRLGWTEVLTRTLWEADHIVPVVEGGGGCGLDGLRTLCVPCHRAETAELARRRAKARRAAGPQIGLGFES